MRFSRWVETTYFREDGEEVLLPFRVRVEVSGNRIRVRCRKLEEDGWTPFECGLPHWQRHDYVTSLNESDMDSLAVASSDTFLQWLEEYGEVSGAVDDESSFPVVTGWFEDPKWSSWRTECHSVDLA